MPHPTSLTPSRSALLVIDVQERLIGKIPGHDHLVQNISFLVDGAHLLGVEVLATEQYPKGLGPTVASLAAKIPHRQDKTDFSCYGVPGLAEELKARGRQQIVLAGIESHVCVLNTALDLLSDGFLVYLAVDALGSRFAIDHHTALCRLEKAGAILTTSETTVFEWTAGSHHPQFKPVSALIQDRMKSLQG